MSKKRKGLEKEIIVNERGKELLYMKPRRQIIKKRRIKFEKGKQTAHKADTGFELNPLHGIVLPCD